MSEGSCFEHLAGAALPVEYQRICSKLFGLTVNFRNPERCTERLIPSGTEGFSRFCGMVRQVPRGSAMCGRSDMRAIERVKQTREAYVYRCPAGLTEVAIPVIVDGTVQAVLLTGQFLTSPPADGEREQASVLAAELHLDPRELREALDASVLIPEDRLGELVKLLSLFCDHVAGLGHDLLFLQRKAESDVVGRIREYVYYSHGDESLSLRTIAAHVHLSASYVSRLFHRETGSTITHHINEVRVGRSKPLLATTKMTVSEICHAVGYRSLSHFTKTFRNVVGVSPTLYRLREARRWSGGGDPGGRSALRHGGEPAWVAPAERARTRDGAAVGSPAS